MHANFCADSFTKIISNLSSCTFQVQNVVFQKDQQKSNPTHFEPANSWVGSTLVEPASFAGLKKTLSNNNLRQLLSELNSIDVSNNQ